jgi:hypothetical protein
MSLCPECQPLDEQEVGVRLPGGSVIKVTVDGEATAHQVLTGVARLAGWGTGVDGLALWRTAMPYRFSSSERVLPLLTEGEQVEIRTVSKE